jgi:hypothetical protein
MFLISFQLELTKLAQIQQELAQPTLHVPVEHVNVCLGTLIQALLVTVLPTQVNFH